MLCSSCSEITDQPCSCDQSCRDTEYCCCNHYDFPPFVLILSFIIGSYLEYRYDHKSYGYDSAADKKCCHLFFSFRLILIFQALFYFNKNPSVSAATAHIPPAIISIIVFLLSFCINSVYQRT